MFVKENRQDPESRVIPIHFMRFKAEEAIEGRAPIFLIAGGPGSYFDFNQAANFEIAKRLRRTRDVVYVGQRGNRNEPVTENPPFITKAQPLLNLRGAPIPLDKPLDVQSRREYLRHHLTVTQEKLSAQGVDLEGYDILHITDDLNDVRQALDYDKIALRACSFGSQWSFSYLKRWPNTVERALLSGIEPLDYAYDDPTGLWKGFARLATLAEQDKALAPYIPEGGLMDVIKTIITRLENHPVNVDVSLPDGKKVNVVLGADDFRQMLRYSYGQTRWEEHQNWPKFLLEIYNGDFRYIASLVAQQRQHGRDSTLITLLIDNSLGISAQRDAQLLAKSEARWLGDINNYYRDSRDIIATPQVSDSFRADFPIDIPVLLVNGDVDWSTPYENAEHALKYLKNGHLIRINGAGHCPLPEELRQHAPEVVEKIYQFFEADFDRGEHFFEQLPDEIDLPDYDFATPNSPSLFEQSLRKVSGE